MTKDKSNSNSNNAKQERKKVFNIQLSEEDKENVYEINDDDDKDDEEEEELEDIGDQINKNDNNNQSNNANSQATSEKSKQSTSNTDSENQANSNSNDIYMICHYLYPKGTIVDINDIDIHRFIKIKQPKKGMLSIFGFGNKKQAQEVELNYLAFFHENYIYFMKDIECHSNNASYRLIGNRYNLLKIYHAFFDQIDNQKWKIRLEFVSLGDCNINKIMIFNKESADRFYETLNIYLKKLNMKMSNTELLQESNPSSS